MFLSLLGNMCLIMALFELSHRMLDQRDAMVRKAQGMMITVGLGHRNHEAQTMATKKAAEILKRLDPALAQVAERAILRKEQQVQKEALVRSGGSSGLCPKALASVRLLEWNMLWLSLYALTFGLFYSLIEGWTFIDGIYFAIISATGVGYGDLSPQTPGGRALCIFTLPVAAVFLNFQVGDIANRVCGDPTSKGMRNLINADLSIENLLAMDEDGDGEVCYLLF